MAIDNNYFEVLLCNVDRSPDSHNAILKIADERRSAVIIMPEPNLRFCQFRNYFLDKREDVAAFTTPHLTGACREWRSESGFLSFVHNDMFFGVYVSPNCPISVFESFLLRLEQAIHSQQLPVILSGDFNARSAAWGDRADVVCTRGRRLEEWVMANDLVVHNDSNGKIPSFSSSNGQSFIDLVISSRKIEKRISSCETLITETASRHRSVVFRVDGGPLSSTVQVPSPPQPTWWFDKAKFKDFAKETVRLTKEQTKSCALTALT